MLNDLAFVSLAPSSSGAGRVLRRHRWRWRGAAREVLLGVLLFLLMSFTASLIDRVLEAAGVTLPAHPIPPSLIARSAPAYVAAFVLVTVVAFSEETIFRGYLIHRLTAVTGSRVAAVALSTFVFALGHGYEGLTGVAAVFLIGLYLAVIYLWRGSLIAPMVIHFLQDFLGLLAAALSHR
jgi:membrane protease YdiL (CAAX protease family)